MCAYSQCDDEAVAHLHIKGIEVCEIIIIIIIIIIITIYLLTSIEFSLGGCSPYTSTDKTYKNKYTYKKQYKNTVQTIQNTVNTSTYVHLLPKQRHITKHTHTHTHKHTGTPTHYKTSLNNHSTEIISNEFQN
jgi:hypothetical protein